MAMSAASGCSWCRAGDTDGSDLWVLPDAPDATSATGYPGNQQRPRTRSCRMRISSRGQVTIPAGLRRDLGFRPGDEVDVTADRDHAHPLPADLRRSAGVN
ncbi:AbrB/MazE/SpoVT family DNA-binding domain-containing protein [Corynebacterium nuruki]